MQAMNINEVLVDQQKTKRKELRSDVMMILHTHIAQSLFNGAWRHGKMGLLQFAKLSTILWNAAKNDDPYAEWLLLKTDQAVCDGREKLKQIETELTPYLNNLRGFTIGDCISVQPIQYNLQFSTPFGFMGAYLMADFDYVLRQRLLIKRMGIALKEDITIQQLVDLVQVAFSVPRHWRKTGVTREDFINNTPKANETKAMWGEIPSAVFNKEIDFSFLQKR